MQIGLLEKCGAGTRKAMRAGGRAISGFANDASGATLIDYALLAGLVALAAVEGFQIMGDAVVYLFDGIADTFVQSMPQSP